MVQVECRTSPYCENPLIRMNVVTLFYCIFSRNLHHLETPGDPAWQCLTAQHDYILDLLISVRNTHLNREMADHDLGSGGGKMVSNSGGSRNTTPAAKYNKIMMSSVGEWQVE